MSEAKEKSEYAEEYYKQINEYLKKKFFEYDDRKICFLLGRYYSYLAEKEKNELKTTSLYTKLPSYTRRIDREQIMKMLEKCNSVVARLVAKHKSLTQTLSGIRDMLNELLIEDKWESSHEELSLAFMMGFTVYISAETREEDADSEK